MATYKQNALGFSGINHEAIHIESDGGSTSVVGWDSVNLFRLISLKQALVFQLKGLRLTRVGSGTTLGRRLYGLRGNAATQLAAVEAEIANIKKLQEEVHNG
jgi:hypothetical protein